VSTLTLIGIAIGLAMDAFAVAIGAGLQLREVTPRQTFRLAWHFGLFQAFMPVLGWLAGLTLVDYIAPIDHWIAFCLLTFIGAKMIYEALKPEEEEVER
jgi:putative Mn2+ efflux pump MntP